MRCESREIELFRIKAENEDFRITTNPSVDDLIQSINRLGIINAPVVLPDHDTFITVCGFRRIEAARSLKLTRIRAKVLAPDIPPQQCVRLCIADNSFQRPLNLIEISRSFALLQKHFIKPSAILKEARLLGLPSNMHYLQKVTPLCHLPENIQEAILSELITLSTAQQLSEMPQNEAVEFVNLFSALKCSLNKQREIILLATEIAIRDDISVINVLNDPPIQKIILNQELDKNQKTAQVRALLRKRRYPHITQTEQRFFSRIEKLGLGENFRLIPPPDFEGNTFRLVLDFKNLDDIKAHCQKLHDVIIAPEFASLFQRH